LNRTMSKSGKIKENKITKKKRTKDTGKLEKIKQIKKINIKLETELCVSRR